MNENLKTKWFLGRSLLKLTACICLTFGIGQVSAAPGSPGNAPSAAVQQETATIKGRVVDENGEGMVGVSIREKGTNNGTITGTDGSYTLNVKGQNSVLVFSYIGYAKQEIVAGNNKSIQVTLKEDARLVDEVVVIGYGTQRKGDVTSAISSVKSEDFTNGFIRDAADLIKGKIAGLNITNGSGDPSSEATIRLRGINSLMSDATPLVLINGVPGSMSSVASEDIESIDVLKDGSAAAIYGTRGSQGVIIITTKSGKRNMKPEVDYSAYVSASDFGKTADFLNANDIRSLLKAGTKLPFSDEGATTDWLSAITRTAFSQNHSVILKGGQENSNYSANISYADKNGVFIGTDNKQLKASFDINQYFLNDKVKINFNIVKGQTQYNLTGGNSSFEPTVYRQALIRNPTSPISTSTGTWVESSRFQYYNPVAMIDETDGINKDDYTRLSSTLTIRPIKDIEVNAMFSNRNDNSINDYYETQENYSTTNGGKNGVASKSSSSNFSNDMDLTAKYSKTIDKHNFSAMIGYSYEYTESESFYASNYNFPSDSYTYNNIGTGYALQDGKAGMGSGKSSSTLIGGFSRISYGYDNRYNLLASIRREGSSKFGNNYKWGSFPSVSAGWTISNEEFMKPVTFVDNLKLRTGYGITGVIPSAPYASQTLLVYDSNGYFDNNGTWIKGIIPYSNPNPNLRWETSGELNIGLDFAVLKSRISGSVDVYNKRTKDMLWNYNVPVPPYLFPTVLANVGEMSNKGIEVVLTAIPLKNKDFEWTSTITLSHNENKLISLSNDFYKIDNNYMNMGDTGDPISFATHRLEVGQSIGNFWGLKSVGVTHKGDEFGTDGSAAKPEGQWIIETSKGVRKVLTPDMYGDENKQYLGNGIPQVNAGWTNTIRFKNFDLSMVMNGAFGFQILNSQRMFYENPNINYNMLKSAFNKVYGQAVLNYPQTFVSYYIENGDYVKIDNITLGYTLDVKKINFLKSLRIYASAQNLACFTKYKGLDPEIPDSGTLTPGVDSRDKFPSTRTFTFGLNVTF